MPIQDSDYFLIDDDGVTKKIRADNLRSGYHSTHSDKKLLVNLSDQVTSKFVYAGDIPNKVNGNHWMLINRGDTTSYKVSGDKVAEYLNPYKRISYTADGNPQTISSLNNTTGESMLLFHHESGPASGMVDTVRGNTSFLPFTNGGKNAHHNDLITFGADSFTLGVNAGIGLYDSANINRSGADYKVWQFKTAPGFFDIVEYTGNGSPRTLQHSLGVAPEMIMIQVYSDTTGSTNDSAWTIYHKGAQQQSNATNRALFSDGQQRVVADYFNGYVPTANDFQVGGNTVVNTGINTTKYIAYLFADEPDQGIKCGLYSGDGGNQKEIHVGFKPEAVFVKLQAGTGFEPSSHWIAFDRTNNGVLEASDFGTLTDGMFVVTDTGFNAVGNFNLANSHYVYLAVR